MLVTSVTTRIFPEQGSLSEFIRAHVRTLPEKSILVVTSKIVALSEGRFAAYSGLAQKNALIRKESQRAFKSAHAWLTMRDGMIMANSGIDESNADGKLILLPKDAFESAARMRRELMGLYKVRRLGVIISDSAIHPLRAGVTAHAVGYAGIRGVRDYRGKKDIFGKKMEMMRTNVADSLATAAALVMGEGAERRPLAVITDAPVVFAEKTDRTETNISIREDLYAPLLRRMRKGKD